MHKQASEAVVNRLITSTLPATQTTDHYNKLSAKTGKSQIKSYCQISNHSINRFKSFGQISNLIISSNLISSSDKSRIKSIIFVFNSTLLFRLLSRVPCKVHICKFRLSMLIYTGCSTRINFPLYCYFWYFFAVFFVSCILCHHDFNHYTHYLLMS